MIASLTIECAAHFRRIDHGTKELRAGSEPQPPAVGAGRVPRLARLMALALRFEQLLRTGEIANCGELARLGHVTRPRISQVMSLLQLAPDVQEAILFLPLTERGRDPIRLAQLMPIARMLDWKKQRRLWAGLARTVNP
jgi:hypothetical protein